MTRPNRICDVCGGFDDHPRHVVAHVPGTAPAPDQRVLQVLATKVDFTTPEGAAALVDFMDTSLQLRHMDCCRAVGCLDGTCNIVTSGAEDLRGAELLAHLTTRDGETNFVDGRPASELQGE